MFRPLDELSDERPAYEMGRFPSGQRGQTVNLLAQPSKVRILLSPKSLFRAEEALFIGIRIKKYMADSFYKEGLRFECTRCSSCCRFTPGYVFLTFRDLKNLLKATGLPRAEFLGAYIREVNLNGIKRISSLKRETMTVSSGRREDVSYTSTDPSNAAVFPSGVPI